MAAMYCWASSCRCGKSFASGSSALQHNPPVRAYYQKLQARGKTGKPALVAAAKKLLLICWACVKNGREFDAGYVDRWR
jgi:hypothetical protein